MNVYCITFPNNKRYVGVETRTGKRKNKHSCGNGKQLVSKAIRKYGWINCKFEYLIMDKLPEQCYSLEKTLIALWNLQNRIYGYNISSGGEKHAMGWKPSDETKQKISQANKGKKISEETRKRLSISHLGQKPNCGNFKKGQVPWNKDKKMGSAWNKNKPGTRLGVKESLETREKKRQSMLKYFKKIRSENLG